MRTSRRRARVDVAIAHDYLTQRGGAERVVLELAAAFPGASVFTSLFDPAGTFDGFGSLDVRTGPLQHVPGLAAHHRLGLPLYPFAMSGTVVEADTVICSSSGWAHGIRSSGRRVGYLHAPARWLYQRDRYVTAGARGRIEGLALDVTGRYLRRWDRRAVDGLDRVLCNSSVVASSIQAIYGREASVVPPPPALTPGGDERPIAAVGTDGELLLCVARLLPYKNVDVVIEAARRVGVPLVVVGRGPEEARLRALSAGSSSPVHILTDVDDAGLRWLYRRSTALVAISHEDYGITPLEAASFGRPSLVLRSAGYVDTMQEGLTARFIESPDIEEVVDGIVQVLSAEWDEAAIRVAVAPFGAANFRDRMRETLV